MARFSCSSFLVLAALLFSLEVSAARQVIPEPGEVQRAWVPGTGPSAFVDSRDWNATVSTQSGSRVQLPVTAKRSYGWPKWAAGAKSFIKTSPQQAAAAAGMAGIFAAVDWVMTDGALTRKGDTSVCFSAGVSGGIGVPCTYGSAQQACTAFLQAANINYSQGGAQYNPAWPAGPCWYYEAGSGYYRELGTWGRTETTSPRVPVTDAEIDSLIDGINSPSVAAESAPFIADNVPGSFDYPDGFEFTGPQSIDLPGVVTTSTDPATGSTTTTEVLPSVQFDYGVNPWSITPTDKSTKNTYKDGTKTNTEESVSTDPQRPGGVTVSPPKVEIPTDCDFMPTVCNFIDWVKQPFEEEEPDLSELIGDDDFTKSVTFSGNSSCPAPTTINTAFGTQVFDWTPGCEWAAMLKPLIILGALLAALYISLGLGRSD